MFYALNSKFILVKILYKNITFLYYKNSRFIYNYFIHSELFPDQYFQAIKTNEE